jgi:5-methylcytosine-specific restriction protein A
VKTPRQRVAATQRGPARVVVANERAIVRPAVDNARSKVSATTRRRAGSADAQREVVARTWSLCSWSPWLPAPRRKTPKPKRLLYLCRWPICPTKLERPGYCDQHRKKLGSGWAQRPSKGDDRGEWPRIRARVLAEEPNCRLCGAPATEVNHVLPIAMGGTHHRSNLRALCSADHKVVTAAIPRRGRPA